VLGNFDDVNVYMIKSFAGANSLEIAVGLATLIWAIWKATNEASFKGVSSGPNKYSFHMYHLITFWADIQKQSFWKLLRCGAKLLMLVATRDNVDGQESQH
jgi:hypothetical protein